MFALLRVLFPIARGCPGGAGARVQARARARVFERTASVILRGLAQSYNTNIESPVIRHRYHPPYKYCSTCQLIGDSTRQPSDHVFYQKCDANQTKPRLAFLNNFCSFLIARASPHSPKTIKSHSNPSNSVKKLNLYQIESSSILRLKPINRRNGDPGGRRVIRHCTPCPHRNDYHHHRGRRWFSRRRRGNHLHPTPPTVPTGDTRRRREH